MRRRSRPLAILPRRTAALLGILLGCLASIAGAAGTRVSDTAFTPADDAPLEASAEAVDPQLRALHEEARALALQPRDAVRAAHLARAWLQRARRDADPRLVGYAQAALQPWWTMSAPPCEILFLRASLKQTIHQFDAALVDLDAALARADLDRGTRLQALVTRATVLDVLGRPGAAAQDCSAIARAGERTAALLCSAQTDALGAQAGRSLAVLLVYFRQGGFGADPAIRLWGDVLLAETAARLKQPEQAEAAFRAALKEDPQDSYTLAAYADFLLDQDRASEVRPLLQPWLRADALLLRHAIALRRLHDPAAIDESRQLGSRFAAQRAHGDFTHQREEAVYRLALCDDGPGALRLALANWQVQREPADLRILAEAAQRTQDAGARATVRDWLKRSGLIDLASVAIQGLAAAG